jgi:L-histidine Nalpha-methyltransferase / hercynylcysteine S-oxide synthase
MSTRIIDVRLNDDTSNGEANLHDEIVKGLSQPFNEKTLPSVLLYDEEGLRLYDDFATSAKEYYLFPAEETLLKSNAYEIAKIMYSRSKRDHQEPIHVESVILELGAG